MNNNENIELNEYKKEFYEEIRGIDVQVKDLEAMKISNKTLAAEVALRRRFGDEITVSKAIEADESEEKTIAKLDTQDIEFDGTVRDICERTVDGEFDSEADKFNAYINNQE
jgi:hypothetical protein